MNDVKRNWTGNIQLGAKADHQVVSKQLCKAFNACPFFKYCGMVMRVVDGQIEAYVEMQTELVGNVAFQILHGGVAATILDSIGGVAAMEQLYLRATPEDLPDTIKKVSRLATVDMRVDYLAPGRGKYFIARAETLRLGRKGCTMRMTMVNDEDKPIATAIASYAY
ncbi:thioesterase family protein [Acinetobacter colistiniresistens]|uniref:thioesterase family protein n=1 Tax=Acinetobacter colistiniresistens TaxID=280145 RepID=UPI00211BD2C3|nr:thioesterase family protein [Acinetobacter colistiniresistens]UUM27376.1 thioesterase family protein [Acinetobacter colistiniresistens]